MADRFFIAPYDSESGQQTNLRPWLIPDTAFEELTNAYVFRGRVRKRFGSRWMGNSSLLSRFRILMGVTAAGGLSGNVRTINADAGMPTAVGQGFSVNDIFFTVHNSAGGPQQMYRTDGSAAPATYNLTNSDFNITATGAPDGTPVYFYPGFPVMGLLDYEQADVNNEFIIGFDTRYAYQYLGGWQRLNGETAPGDAVWTGNNAQFFWGTTWTGTTGADRVFFVTNFNENEPNFMRRFIAATWTSFRPLITATDNLNSARIILPFKNRLVVLNTWEGATGAAPGLNYPNRARYSQVGSPLAVDAWRQDIPGKGNAIDAATTEAIITAEFIRDRLIVFFERSTWELVFTGNQAYPFTWQKINTELGAESTFSIVPFDKVALGVGNVGIHQCNGVNVDRIDDKIPDAVFDIHNVDGGVFRVYGIRDYFVEMIYWTFPDTQATTDFPYPNRVLVYNYKKGTWAFNQDSITVFGYFQPTDGVTWDSETVTWDDAITWDSGEVQAQFRQVIAGNQEGYTFVCDADVPVNAAVLQITDLSVLNNIVTLTVINHNLRVGEFVYFTGITGTGNLTLLNHRVFEVMSIVDANIFTITYTDDVGTILAGIYSGGGLISRVSNIVIRTKEYNFYADKGRNAYVSKVDFMVDNNSIVDADQVIISGSQLQANFYASTNDQNLLDDAAATGTLLGTGTLDAFAYESIPFERDATRLWHPVYFQAEGEVVQLELTMNNEQITTVIPITVDGITSYTGPAFVDFQLHALCIHAVATSYRFQ